jgi:hypothetical protein
MGDRMFSREPLALVTNDDDPEWSALVNTVVNIFFYAEAVGATSNNTDALLDTNSSDDLMVIVAAVVSQLGNYGEQYVKHLEAVVPRGGLNSLVHKQSAKRDRVAVRHSLRRHRRAWP